MLPPSCGSPECPLKSCSWEWKMIREGKFIYESGRGGDYGTSQSLVGSGTQCLHQTIINCLFKRPYFKVNLLCDLYSLDMFWAATGVRVAAERWTTMEFLWGHRGLLQHSLCFPPPSQFFTILQKAFFYPLHQHCIAVTLQADCFQVNCCACDRSWNKRWPLKWGQDLHLNSKIV